MTVLPVDPPEYDGFVSLTADALDLIEAGIEQLSRVVSDDIEADTDPENAVTLLHRTRALRQRLAQVEAFVEAHAIPLLDYGKQEVAGLLVEVRGGAKRSEWRHDDVAWALTCDLAAVDGVIDDADAALVAKVRDRILNAAGISYWRTTQLRAAGVDPSQFCKTERGRRTVQLSPLAEDGEPE